MQTEQYLLHNQYAIHMQTAPQKNCRYEELFLRFIKYTLIPMNVPAALPAGDKQFHDGSFYFIWLMIPTSFLDVIAFLKK